MILVRRVKLFSFFTIVLQHFKNNSHYIKNI